MLKFTQNSLHNDYIIVIILNKNIGLSKRKKNVYLDFVRKMLN